MGICTCAPRVLTIFSLGFIYRSVKHTNGKLHYFLKLYKLFITSSSFPLMKFCILPHTSLVFFTPLQQRAGSELQLASLRSEQDSEGYLTPEYCIDAGSIGNVARFINHSCQPNIFIQCVLSSHRDIKLAKIMLFAADTIPPLQVSFHE
jgi:hypothetical protein